MGRELVASAVWCFSPLLLCRADAPSCFGWSKGACPTCHSWSWNSRHSLQVASVASLGLGNYRTVPYGPPGLGFSLSISVEDGSFVAGPRLPRISPSRRGGIFLPVGRLARNKCPPVLAATPCARAVALRCVGASEGWGIFAHSYIRPLSQASKQTKGPPRSARFQVRCLGFRLVRIPSSGGAYSAPCRH